MRPFHQWSLQFIRPTPFRYIKMKNYTYTCRFLSSTHTHTCTHLYTLWLYQTLIGLTLTRGLCVRYYNKYTFNVVAFQFITSFLFGFAFHYVYSTKNYQKEFSLKSDFRLSFLISTVNRNVNTAVHIIEIFPNDGNI